MATVDGAGRRAEMLGDPPPSAEHPGLVAWARGAARPCGGRGREAAGAVLVGARTASGRSGRAARGRPRERRAPSASASDGRAYEIHGPGRRTSSRLLEGRTALIEEAFERRIFIRGSFPEISVLSAAAFDVRMGGRRRWLNSDLAEPGSPPTGPHRCASRPSTTTGCVLGKYLSAPKFLCGRRERSDARRHRASASISAATSRSAGTGAAGGARWPTSRAVPDLGHADLPTRPFRVSPR